MRNRLLSICFDGIAAPPNTSTKSEAIPREVDLRTPINHRLRAIGPLVKLSLTGILITQSIVQVHKNDRGYLKNDNRLRLRASHFKLGSVHVVNTGGAPSVPPNRFRVHRS